MPTKTLLINSSVTKSEVQGKWHIFEEAQPYIQGIETGQLAEEINSEILNSLISGIPSPWARARLFGFAFPYTQAEANIRTSGLIEYYEKLIEEWKGLLACIALFPNRITVSPPISMDFRNTNEWFNIPNSLGRMLFEDKDLWTDPDKLDKDPDALPSVQLIYYAGKLVGATTPYSIIFTAADYRNLPQTEDVSWYKEGAFQDPVRLNVLTNDQKQKLYLLVRNIIDIHFPDFEQRINSNRKNKPRLDFNGLKEFLRRWKQEIKDSGDKIVDDGTLDASLQFVEPYYPLFNVKQTLYVHPNLRISFRKGDDALWEVDPKEILLQEDYVLEFKEEDPEQPLKESAIHYLTVPNPDFDPKNPEREPENLYFPIPLSEKGLLIFRNRIGDLISGRNSNDHELLGHIKSTEYKLVVELHLIIDGKKLTPIVKEYSIEPIENEKRVIAWPNFIAEQWESYYLYSEFASSDTSTQMIPFFKNAGNNSEILVNSITKKILYANSENLGNSELRIEKLVTYPKLTLDSSFHKYDVIRSNRPFAGLELRKSIDGDEYVMGYLIVKNPEDDSMGDKKIKDLSNMSNRIDVVVGVDFGSNNSCFQFATQKDHVAKPIPFTNRRIFFVGSEVVDRSKAKLATRHELYFFQNESPINGQIKSWLHEHYHQYVNSGYSDQEISGGISVFKPNIQIKDMDERTIKTNAGVLHHSMKWLTEQKDIDKKTAYLKMTWLKALADLFANNFKPVELRWSYPGSFSKAEVLQYKTLYRRVVALNPIKNLPIELNGQPLTEAEAVSNYALTTDLGLGSRNLFLGIDVGGSTSDILLIAMDRSSKKNRLLKQSSVRLAAGYLMKAIDNSLSYRETILGYHNSPNSPLSIPNIQTMIDRSKTAPFFLNSIFDRLDTKDFNAFYLYLSKDNPKIFALPAYLTGLLLFYAGQLVGKTIKENDFLKEIKIVDLFPFGKGGRIFDWLDVYPGDGESKEYLNLCFRKGLGEIENDIQVLKQDNIRTDNKSEVAIGLVSANSSQSVVADASLRTNSDIFGESGFKFYKDPNNSVATPLEAHDIVSTDHFEDLQFALEFPEKFVEFEKFLDVFLEFVGPNTTGIIPNTKILREKSGSLGRQLKSYITNDPEFRKAHNPLVDSFDFKHSMLVLEGMCFLERMLIPEVFKN